MLSLLCVFVWQLFDWLQMPACVCVCVCVCQSALVTHFFKLLYLQRASLPLPVQDLADGLALHSDAGLTSSQPDWRLSRSLLAINCQALRKQQHTHTHTHTLTHPPTDTHRHARLKSSMICYTSCSGLVQQGIPLGFMIPKVTHTHTHTHTITLRLARYRILATETDVLPFNRILSSAEAVEPNLLLPSPAAGALVSAPPVPPPSLSLSPSLFSISFNRHVTPPSHTHTHTHTLSDWIFLFHSDSHDEESAAEGVLTNR